MGFRSDQKGRPRRAVQQHDLAEAGGSAMTTFDFAPLFRTAIGFDRLARLMDTATSATDVSTYPPYNIEKTGEDTYRLTMAVAGFRPEDLDLVAKDNTLVVSGKVKGENGN